MTTHTTRENRHALRRALHQRFFYTQDGRRPLPTASACTTGASSASTTNSPPSLFRAVHDSAGAAVVPGFNDAHCHLCYVGQAVVQADLRPAACDTMDELLAAVDAPAAAAPEGAWVQGAGYDQNHLGNRTPRRSSWMPSATAIPSS